MVRSFAGPGQRERPHFGTLTSILAPVMAMSLDCASATGAMHARRKKVWSLNMLNLDRGSENGAISRS